MLTMKNNTPEKLVAFSFKQLYQNINNRFLYIYAIKDTGRRIYLFDYTKTNGSDFCIEKKDFNEDGKINEKDKEFIDKIISEINYDNRVWQKVDFNNFDPRDRIFIDPYITSEEKP